MVTFDLVMLCEGGGQMELSIRKLDIGTRRTYGVKDGLTALEVTSTRRSRGEWKALQVSSMVHYSRGLEALRECLWGKRAEGPDQNCR